jgi:uncharacterized protein YbjT (DUF2867 family)
MEGALMRHALVFGGSGQIGEPMLARLRTEGWRITAVSRKLHRDGPGLSWRHGSFDAVPDLPAHVDAILSAGPLDAFSHWYARAAVDAARRTRVVLPPRLRTAPSMAALSRPRPSDFSVVGALAAYPRSPSRRVRFQTL